MVTRVKQHSGIKCTTTNESETQIETGNREWSSFYNPKSESDEHEQIWNTGIWMRDKILYNRIWIFVWKWFWNTRNLEHHMIVFQNIPVFLFELKLEFEIQKNEDKEKLGKFPRSFVLCFDVRKFLCIVINI